MKHVFSFSRERLAHALSIIAESGLHGFEYKSAVAAASGHTYKSNKSRWTPRSNPTFSAMEFRHYLSIAALEGMIDAGDYTERLSHGEYTVDYPILRLTLKGWTHLADFDRPILEQWVRNIIQNLPTVVITLLVSWILYYFGAPR